MLNSKSLGKKIASVRKKMNLSQAELAKQVNISPQAVGKWERGESMPDIVTLNRIAIILSVDLNYFSDNFQESINPTIEHPNQDISTYDQNLSSSINSSRRKPQDWNWDMSEGNWIDADFSGLKNLKEKFGSSNMKNCKFSGSDLSGLILSKNNIELCDFSNSDLRDSTFQSSNLLNNQFSECSFIDTEVLKCNIEKCNFSHVDFSGTEFKESNLEKNILTQAQWKFTKFSKSNISNMVFSGTFEDCHFEQCSFYGVSFENTTIINTFFKYNERFRKVQFINCKVDRITYAFLKNNQANLTGVEII